MSTTWVPDDSVTACLGCKSGFGIFNRKHHCRNCGHIFCQSCSSNKFTLRHRDGPVRVCDGCYKKLATKQKAASIITLGKPTTRLLYETRSVCIQCSISEQKGFKFGHVVAYVLQYEDKIYLYTLCSQHPHVPNITLLCSNATFYHYLMTFKQSFEYGYSIVDQFLAIPPLSTAQLAAARPFQALNPTATCLSTTSTLISSTNSLTLQPQSGGKTANVEQDDPYHALSSIHTIPVQVINDGTTLSQLSAQPNSLPPLSQQQIYGLESKELYRRLLLPHKTPHLLPLVVEVELAFADGQLRSDSEIISELYEIMNFYPHGHGFLLKINVGLAGSFVEDTFSVLIEVNHKLLFIQEWLDRYYTEQEQLFQNQGAISDLNLDLTNMSLNENIKGPEEPPQQNTSVFNQIKQQQAAAHAEATSSQSSSSTQAVHKITILVDISFDRLLLLCDVPQSIFLKSNVYPFLRYYLIPGEEQTCTVELREAFNKLQTFSHMSICIMILFESEGGLLLPDLKPIMRLLLEKKNIVRMILFNQQRNVTTVVSRATDRYMLVQNLLQQATAGGDANTMINNTNNDYQHNFQQQVQLEKAQAAQALKELNIDDQMIRMIQIHEAALYQLQQQQSQQRHGSANPNSNAAPLPQQIRYNPKLLSELTYKWLQSPLYYYSRQQSQQQALGKMNPSTDTCMETVDIMPLLNAINKATNNNTPISAWFPLSAFQPLSALLSKRLRTNLLLNFNVDPLSSICTVIIHKAGYGIPSTVVGNGGTTQLGQVVNGNIGSPFDVLNIGTIFDLKKLMNQVEQLTRDFQQHQPQTNAGNIPVDNVQRQQSTWKGILSNLLKINEIINNSTLPGAPVGVTSLFNITGESKQQQKQKIKSTQMICILNSSDIGCIDVLRRCRSLSVTRNNNVMANSMMGGGNMAGGSGFISTAGSGVQFVSSDHQCL